MVDKRFQVVERKRALAVTKAHRFPCTSLLPVKGLFRMRNMNVILLTLKMTIILMESYLFSSFCLFNSRISSAVFFTSDTKRNKRNY